MQAYGELSDFFLYFATDFIVFEKRSAFSFTTKDIRTHLSSHRPVVRRLRNYTSTDSTNFT